MEKNYWNRNGRHQGLLVRLEELIPAYGYTTSPPLNALICAEHLYYDVYNNGGCNIADCYMRDVRKYLKAYSLRFPVTAFLRRDYRRMEEAMDTLIEKIAGESIESFEVEELRLWASNDKKRISISEPEDKDGWFSITFGLTEEMLDWARRHKRCGFSLVA